MGEDLDGRADQYALAASCYELARRHNPVPPSNAAVIISRHLNAAADNYFEWELVPSVYSSGNRGQ
jgi:hypothetical protein